MIPNEASVKYFELTDPGSISARRSTSLSGTNVGLNWNMHDACCITNMEMAIKTICKVIFSNFVVTL